MTDAVSPSNAAKLRSLSLAAGPGCALIVAAFLLFGSGGPRFSGSDEVVAVSVAAPAAAPIGGDVDYEVVTSRFSAGLNATIKVVRHKDSGCLFHLASDRAWMVPVFQADGRPLCPVKPA